MRKAEEAFSRFERGSLIWLIVFMTAAVFAGVLFRYLPFKNNLLLGSEEFGRLGIVWLWLWGGAVVHRRHGHYRVSVIFDRLSKKGSFILSTVGSIVSLAVAVELTRQFLVLFIRSLGLTTLALQLPLAIFTLPTVLGCGLLGIYTLVNLARERKDISI